MRECGASSASLRSSPGASLDSRGAPVFCLHVRGRILGIGRAASTARLRDLRFVAISIVSLAHARTMTDVRVGADRRPPHGERDTLLGCSSDLLLAECGAGSGAGRSCTRIGNAEAARSCRRRQSCGQERLNASFAEVRRDHDICIEGANDNTHRMSLSAWRLFLIRCSSARPPGLLRLLVRTEVERRRRLRRGSTRASSMRSRLA
jgi:hypothetical protein